MIKNKTGMEDFGCDLEPKPIIKKLEEALKRDSVVHLEGYVGSSVEGTLRLYRTLNLESYVEVSKEEVIACVEIPNDNCGRVKVFIPASTMVKSLTQSHASIDIPQPIPCTYSMPPDICGMVRDALDRNLYPELRELLQDFYDKNCGVS